MTNFMLKNLAAYCMLRRAWVVAPDKINSILWPIQDEFRQKLLSNNIFTDEHIEVADKLVMRDPFIPEDLIINLQQLWNSR